MPIQELERASEHLRAASESAGPDARERLHDQSAQLADLATRDRGPDHGRLARHERILTDIAEAADGPVAEDVERALAELRSYRETVEGV